MGGEEFPASDEGLLLTGNTLNWIIQICLPVFLVWAILQLWDKYCVISTNSGILPPGGFGWPIIGETVPFVSNGRDYFQSRIAKYGNIFTSHLMGRPTVVVCGAENVKHILTGEHSIVQNHVPPGVAYLLGSGSLSCTRDITIHKMKQKAFRMAFTHRFMNQCMTPMQDIFRSRITSWIGRGYANGVDDVKKMTMLIGAKALLGFDINGEETSKLLRLFNIYNEYFFSLPINLPGTGFRKALEARKELVAMIKENIQKRNNNSCGEDNLLDIWTANTLRQDEDIMKEKNLNGDIMLRQDDESDDVIDMILEVLFSSQSPIASACCAILAHLALLPDVVEGIRSELKQKWSTSTLLDVNPRFENLNDLTYVNDVVKEALRVSPPVAGGFRQTKEPVSLEGFHIPKGWGILYCITDTHENAATFDKEDRLKFKPERWAAFRESQENGQTSDNLQRFEYLPFGGGGRKCVGKEFALFFLRLFIIEMCTLCDWKLVNGDVMPAMKTSPLPFPADGMALVVSKADI